MAERYEIRLASPRGFCAGVERAIETVRQSLRQYGSPVYVLHEIVHNKHVIAELENSGAVFVKRLQDVPREGVCIFSAHGVSVAIEEEAGKLGLRTIDATCPLVTSVHRMVEKYYSDDFDVVIIGHHKHPEVEGTAGRVVGRVHVIASEQEAENLRIKNNNKVAYVTQTTLSKHDISGIMEILKGRYPEIKGPKSNICFATQNRQDAVKQLAEWADVVFVVGSKNSSNSNRLKEVVEKCGVDAFLVDDHGDINIEWLHGKKKIGITAGASAPEGLVGGVVSWLKERGGAKVSEMSGIIENIHFKAAQLK